MRWSNSKATASALTLLLTFFVFSPLYAQDVNHDSVSTYAKHYEQRVEKYQKRFNKLIPTHTRIQMYGDMGLVNLGFGWDYGKRSQWETDILFGLIPRYHAKHAHVTFTIKQGYMPWNISLWRNISLTPLKCGMYINTILSDDDFWIHQPSRYPKGYYWFSTRMQFYFYAGQALNINIPQDKRTFCKAISLYYEIGTNDAYIMSAATNKYLSVFDILRLSFGLKFRIL